MRLIRAALAAGLLLAAAPAALAQPAAQAEAVRALNDAEGELRDVLQRLEDGGLLPGSALSRLRQALNEVERAMMRLPADSRRGAAWQTAVREVTEALALVRQDNADPEAARTAAQEALGALPALKGEDTATGSS